MSDVFNIARARINTLLNQELGKLPGQLCWWLARQGREDAKLLLDRASAQELEQKIDSLFSSYIEDFTENSSNESLDLYPFDFIHSQYKDAFLAGLLDGLFALDKYALKDTILKTNHGDILLCLPAKLGILFLAVFTSLTLPIRQVEVYSKCPLKTKDLYIILPSSHLTSRLVNFSATLTHLLVV